MSYDPYKAEAQRRGLDREPRDRKHLHPLLDDLIGGRIDDDDAAAYAKYLFDTGEDVNRRDISGKTALMRAAFYGFPKCIKIFIARGADVNAVDSNGDTALDEVAEGP